MLDLLRAVREIDAEMRRTDRHSPEYEKLRDRLAQTAREVFYASDGPGADTNRNRDNLAQAIADVERDEPAA